MRRWSLFLGFGLDRHRDNQFQRVLLAPGFGLARYRDDQFQRVVFFLVDFIDLGFKRR